MRKLWLSLWLICVSIPALAVLPINPTTTLTAETGNNTSTADTFVAQTNGNLGAGNVSKLPIRNLLYPGATTKIYAHWMPWFGPSNHMNVGYDSADPAQIKKQVEDMISRGIDGAIVDWYGPFSAHHNTATLNLMREAELHVGFEFAVMEDVGAVRFAADPQQKLIDDLNYIHSTYAPSPAYMRRNGRPVIFFFGLETLPTPINWDVVRASVQGNPLFIFRNSGAFSAAQSDGGYAWLVPQTTVTANYMSLGYLDNFYSTALNFPQQRSFGSAFKGFDDSLAAWGHQRKILQFCGQTWLASMARAGRFYSSSRQLENLQLVTWNDYEEGTELESGVDNCFSLTASIQESTLAWSISGSETTIDHYTVFVSLDGENLMPLADVAPGTHSLDLASFNLGPATYRLYVKAAGKPSIVNRMSNAVEFMVANQPPVALLSVSPTLGLTPLVVNASAQASSDADGSVATVTIDFGDGMVIAQPTAAHTYSLPGFYTVRATVTDNLGATATATSVVEVSNRPPAPVLTVTPSSGSAPLNVSASTAGSSDSDGNLTSAIINFGDGTVISAVPGASASHVYNTPGNYTVTATLTDNLGASSTATAAVTATVPRVVTISTPGNSTTQTSPVQLVANATTPNQFAALQVYVDGVKVHEQTTPDLSRTLILAAGERHIAVKGWDNMGSFMSTIRITVPPNQLPVARLAVTPTSGPSPVTVIASTAGSSDPDGAIASTTVNFGDGTVTSVAPGGAVSHIYSSAGTYLVSATVTDNNGAQSTVAASVNVVAPYVSISVPQNRAIGIAPIKVVAAAYSGNPIAAMKVYVDDVAVYQTTASQINTYLKMVRGTRRITVQAWETNGTVIRASVTIMVR